MLPGIHYYDDDNWITRVPRGILNIHSDYVQAVLRRGRKPSLNGHLSLERSSSEPSTSSNKKTSPVDSLKTFERTASDPLVAAEVLENRLLAQCHVNKAYQNSADDLINGNMNFFPKKGSPVKNSRTKGKASHNNHSSVDKSVSGHSKVSRDSRTDSGFESEQWAKKKGLTTKSGTWTTNPKDIVSIMQQDDNLLKTDSSIKSNPVTPNRSRRKERKRRAKRVEKSGKTGIWSRGKKWAKRYGLDKHIDDDTLSSTGYSESEFESSANSKYKSISELAEQRQNPKVDKTKVDPKTWDDIDLESSYIDPSTIMSVPKMTTRLQHLQEHKDDGLEKPSNVMTTAFVHRKERDDDKPEGYASATSTSGTLTRVAAIRKGQFPDVPENDRDRADVKICNLDYGYGASRSIDNKPSPADEDFGFDEDFMDNELVEWEDETVTMVDTTFPQKSFERYKQAYLENVKDDMALSPTIAAGIQMLPYDVLSEHYLNEEIATEKAAEEEKRRLKMQPPPTQINKQETSPPGKGPTNKHTYLSLLNYAEDEETHCKICGMDHYPICSDPPTVERSDPPTPPPRPDLVEDEVPVDLPHSVVPSPVPQPKKKTNVHDSSIQSSVKCVTSSTAKSPKHATNIITPIQVSVEENEPPVYVNLEEAKQNSNGPVANPPPLPPRHGSLPRFGRNGWSGQSHKLVTKKYSEPESLQLRKAPTKSVTPLMKRKIQQFDSAAGEFDIRTGSSSAGDNVNASKIHDVTTTPVKIPDMLSDHENSSAKVHTSPSSSIKSKQIEKSDVTLEEKKEADGSKLLKPIIDIKIQPATPIHKPSRLEVSSDDNERQQRNEVTDINDINMEDTESTFQRVGSVAQRRKLFERPVVKGHERASARSFRSPMTQGPDRASTRSMDYQMKGRSGITMSVHTPSISDILSEQENIVYSSPENKQVTVQSSHTDTQQNGTVADTDTYQQNGTAFESFPVSKRLAIFEMSSSTNAQDFKPSSNPSRVVNQIKTVAPDETITEARPDVPETVMNDSRKSPVTQVAKENKYEAGWKLHPDKLRIPDIFK